MITSFTIIMVYLIFNPPILSPKFIPSTPWYLYNLQIPQDNNEGINLINQINQRNSKVQSLYYSKIHSTLRQGSKSGKLNGFMAFEKDKNFRMIQNSIFGKEIDIGSNNIYFWFWSKRMKPSILYYSQHENIMKSGLRTPFNPLWIMEIVGLKNIHHENAAVIQLDNFWAIVEERMSTEQKLVTKVILIDPAKRASVGHYIYNKDGQIIVSAEIKEYYDIDGLLVPKEIEVIWFEENVMMIWSFDQPQINQKIDQNLWRIPRQEKMKELGIEVTSPFA